MKTPLEIAMQWSQYYTELNYDSALELVAADAQWLVWGSKALPWDEESIGHEQIRATWETQHRLLTRVSIDIDVVHDLDGEAIVFGRITDKSIKTGKLASFHFCARFVVTDSLISRYEFYPDAAAFERALIDG